MVRERPELLVSTWDIGIGREKTTALAKIIESLAYSSRWGFDDRLEGAAGVGMVRAQSTSQIVRC